MIIDNKTYYEYLQHKTKNGITGKCFNLNFISSTKKNPIENKNKIRPIGICLTTNKKYCLLQDAMSWNIHFITDDLEYFEEETKDNSSGEKGKFKNVDCWTVLEEIQNCMSFQSSCIVLNKLSRL